MSSNSKPKPGCFWKDIHRLLLAAEAGQKADIMAYSSGHLGPRSLIQSQPYSQDEQSVWTMSLGQEGNTKPSKHQHTQRRKTLTYLKEKETQESPLEFSTDTALEREVSKGQATDCSSQKDIRENRGPPKTVNCSSTSVPAQSKALSQRKSCSSSDQGGKEKVCSSHSHQEDLNNEGQLKTKQQLGRRVMAKKDLWAGINVAEMHERKLQKELKKLSAQSWPSRDRLVVFSDVFDDVCEGSPVFGRILREIKTDYDLYVNHLMASQSSLHNMKDSKKPLLKGGTLAQISGFSRTESALCKTAPVVESQFKRSKSPDTSFKDLGNSKVREMELEDAEREVCRLEEEARRSLEENKRVRNELQNVPAVTGPEDSDIKNSSLSGLQDAGTAAGCAGGVQSQRLRVLNTWREIQQLEEEIKEKLVPAATTTATERRIKDVKTEILKLIASNDRLRNINKDLENNINTLLNREKASKAMRRMLWDELHCDLQTE